MRIQNADNLTTGDRQFISIDNDAWFVLAALLERWEDQNALSFNHPAEYVVFMELAGAIERRMPVEQKDSLDWDARVYLARQRRGAGYVGDVPGLGYVRVADDGSFDSVSDPKNEAN